MNQRHMRVLIMTKDSIRKFLVLTLIAEQIIDEGGVVFGAGFDDDLSYS